MLDIEYLPPAPVRTEAFNEARKRFPSQITVMLSMANALQEATFHKMRTSGHSSVEVMMAQIEVALGMGSEAAAILVVEMAGYTQHANGRWHSAAGKFFDWAILDVRPDFLNRHFKELSNYF